MNSDPENYRRFLLLQWRLFTALSRYGVESLCTPLVRELQQRVHQDLVTLDEQPLPASLDLGFRPHPLAVDYVVSGSRLGAQVLKKHWFDSGLTEVDRVCAYLSAPAHTSYWREFLARSTALPAQGKEADTIVIDCITLFKFCLDYALTQPARERVLHA
ncbi:biliverdin-producing heme oxygenase [Phaeobacter sp. HF9A]|uniref:biliverdin-producing heme oxygenase n=1 Tax=Phaeobacter sp. HF9A TaxID=2721561 RepID=UPI001431E053|nr:biliverdin-producing heme oxygenase [Phaeobacter sp. HF9A]NIZ12096.1 biliverdin-producing heme oxygenase [Phaeobacter sp. HF9A]